MSQPVYRFAPSPNGLLHLGHALSAILNYEQARASGGRFLLRIEDIDPTRCRAEFEEAIFEDLAWLGLEWERPVRRQSDHLDDYRAALRQLQNAGLVYPSFESRADIARIVAEREQAGLWPRDPEGAPLYPGPGKTLDSGEAEARIEAGEPYALRLNVAAAADRAGELAWVEQGAGEAKSIAADPLAWGDVVLARKEVPTCYHLSVVVDDALQGVTHVVRGQDLFAATSIHRLLQTLLGLPEPVYRHHPLILDSERRKLSKATKATALRELRARGATPVDIRRAIGLS